MDQDNITLLHFPLIFHSADDQLPFSGCSDARKWRYKLFLYWPGTSHRGVHQITSGNHQTGVTGYTPQFYCSRYETRPRCWMLG